MRNILANLAVLEALAVGPGIPATAHPLSVPPAVVHLSDVEQIYWDGCGPRARNIVDGSVNGRGRIIVGLGINGGKNIVDGTTAVGIHRLMATHRATEDRYHAPSS